MREFESGEYYWVEYRGELFTARYEHLCSDWALCGSDEIFETDEFTYIGDKIKKPVMKHETNFEPGYYWVKFPNQPWEVVLCAGDRFFVPGDMESYGAEDFIDICGTIAPPLEDYIYIHDKVEDDS